MRPNSARNGAGLAAGGQRGVDRTRDRTLVRRAANEERRDQALVEHQVDIVRVVFDVRPGGAEAAGDCEVAERAADPAGRVEHGVPGADRIAPAGPHCDQRAGERCSSGSAGHVGAVGARRRHLDDVVAGTDEREAAADRDRADRIARRERAAIDRGLRQRAGAADRATGIHRQAAGGGDRAVHQQRAGIHRGCAGIGVRSGEVGRTRTVLLQRAGAGDHAAEGDGIGAVEGERPVIENIAHNRTGRPAIAELQRSGVDRRAAGVGVVGRQDGRSGAVLVHSARAGDHTAERQCVRTVEREYRVVENVAGDRAGCSAIAELQCPGADRRAAGIGIVAGQSQRARADLGQRACAGQRLVDTERVRGRHDIERPAVRAVCDRVRERVQRYAGHLQCAAVDIQRVVRKRGRRERERAAGQEIDVRRRQHGSRAEHHRAGGHRRIESDGPGAGERPGAAASAGLREMSEVLELRQRYRAGSGAIEIERIARRHARIARRGGVDDDVAGEGRAGLKRQGVYARQERDRAGARDAVAAQAAADRAAGRDRAVAQHLNADAAEAVRTIRSPGRTGGAIAAADLPAVEDRQRTRDGLAGVDAETAVAAFGTRRSGSAGARRRAGAARYHSRCAIVEAHRAGLEENSAKLDGGTTAIGQVAAADLTRHRRVGACSRRAAQDLAEIQDASAGDRYAKTAAAAGPGGNLWAGRVDRTACPVAATAAADDSAGVVDDLAGRAGRSAVGRTCSAGAARILVEPAANDTTGPTADGLHGSAGAGAAGDLPVVGDDTASGGDKTSAPEPRPR